MRILITGSEGVLGSTLKQKLRFEGHTVWGADLMHTHDPEYLRTDISEHRQVARLFKAANPDLVYNFAAEFGRNNGQAYYEQLWKTNCLGTRNVIEECVRTGATMAHASSSEAYGLAEQYVKGSLTEGLLDKHPPQFHNEYALTKWTNERQITMAARNNGLNAVIFRFFNVYGPPELYSPYRSVICQLAYKILAGLPITITKDGYRSHLWIGDWANALAALPKELDTMAFNKQWPGSGETDYVPVFNVGSDNYESIEAVFNMLVKICGKTPNVSYVETEKANCATKRPDNNHANVWLGLRDTMPLEEGLHLTVNYLRGVYGL